MTLARAATNEGRVAARKAAETKAKEARAEELLAHALGLARTHTRVHVESMDALLAAIAVGVEGTGTEERVNEVRAVLAQLREVLKGNPARGDGPPRPAYARALARAGQ